MSNKASGQGMFWACPEENGADQRNLQHFEHNLEGFPEG